jgi:hypothetical protein
MVSPGAAAVAAASIRLRHAVITDDVAFRVNTNRIIERFESNKASNGSTPARLPWRRSSRRARCSQLMSHSCLATRVRAAYKEVHHKESATIMACPRSRSSARSRSTTPIIIAGSFPCICGCSISRFRRSTDRAPTRIL